VIVSFVDIDGIVDHHHCINLLFTILYGFLCHMNFFV